jgi:hypothetical protein
MHGDSQAWLIVCPTSCGETTTGCQTHAGQQPHIPGILMQARLSMAEDVAPNLPLNLPDIGGPYQHLWQVSLH